MRLLHRATARWGLKETARRARPPGVEGIDVDGPAGCGRERPSLAIAEIWASRAPGRRALSARAPTGRKRPDNEDPRLAKSQVITGAVRDSNPEPADQGMPLTQEAVVGKIAGARKLGELGRSAGGPVRY
jgi:hypothetical protein